MPNKVMWQKLGWYCTNNPLKNVKIATLWQVLPSVKDIFLPKTTTYQLRKSWVWVLVGLWIYESVSKAFDCLSFFENYNKRNV